MDLANKVDTHAEKIETLEEIAADLRDMVQTAHVRDVEWRADSQLWHARLQAEDDSNRNHFTAELTASREAFSARLDAASARFDAEFRAHRDKSDMEFLAIREKMDMESRVSREQSNAEFAAMRAEMQLGREQLRTEIQEIRANIIKWMAGTALVTVATVATTVTFVLNNALSRLTYPPATAPIILQLPATGAPANPAGISP